MSYKVYREPILYLDTVPGTDQREAYRMCKQSWFLSDGKSPSKQKRLNWLYRQIETHGVPNYAEGGIRAMSFADVRGCPSCGL